MIGKGGLAAWEKYTRVKLNLYIYSIYYWPL